VSYLRHNRPFVGRQTPQMTARRPAGRQAGAVRRWRLSFQL